MLFRKPTTDRLGFLMLSLSLFSGFFVVCYELLKWALNTTHDHNGTVWAMFGFVALMFALIEKLLLTQAGPEELLLDMERHTYKQVSGGPVFWKTRTGAWEDFGGVYLRYVWRSAGHSSYLMGVVWRERERKMDLGEYEKREDAVRQAEKIEAALGLRRVPAPPYGNPLDDFFGTHKQ